LQDFFLQTNSPIHALDARVKIVFTIAFILILNLTPMNAWPAYILFLTTTLSLVFYYRIGIGFLLKRALFALPFVFAAVPLIFIGTGSLVSTRLFENIYITISPSGIERFTNIALKAWISMQAAVLLSATTSMTDILSGLQLLKVPAFFVSVIGLMWRYLFLMIAEVKRMLHARTSRSGYLEKTKRSSGSIIWRAKVSGGMAGSLFLRSIERSERVFAAMQSRGYDGKTPISEERLLLPKDRFLLWIGIGLLILVWIIGFLSGT
jgi:cobalt/nickel transport system permease protein